ncbi:MAG: reverse transcriptase domain-containing protein [Gloeomargaritales cyanobacterium]
MLCHLCVDNVKNKWDDGLEKEVNNSHDNPTDAVLCGLTFPDSMKLLSDPNVWIADTAATVHTTSHDVEMKSIGKRTKDSITMGNGSNEKTAKYGNVHGTVCDKMGMVIESATLTNVAHVPSAKFNLFSLSRMQLDGWQLHGNADAIWITKGNKKVVFDVKISTASGAVYCMYFKRGNELANVMTDRTTAISVNEAHDKLGHAHEDAIRATAKALGWELKKGQMNPCDACASGKAKQKNVSKDSNHKPARSNAERLFLDISTIKSKDDDIKPTKSNWRVMVDERTNLKFSNFFESKDGMVEPTCEQLGKWKNAGLKVKYIRLDNAGENKKLAQRTESSDWQLGITYEFTARDTPQQNHLAELAFAVLYNKGRAMMHKANIPKKIRYKLFREAFGCATDLDGLVVVKIDNKTATRYEHFFGKNPAFATHLRTWGEAGTVKIKTTMTPKLHDRGEQCVFVGYAKNHDGDCYRMWNPNTSRVHETRDVIWLKRMFHRKELATHEIVITSRLNSDIMTEEAGEGVDPPAPTNMSAHEDSDDTEDTNEGNDGDGWRLAKTTRSGRAVRIPRRYVQEIGANAIGLTTAEQNYYAIFQNQEEEEFDPQEIACVGAGLGGGFMNTQELHVMKYSEAMKGPDKDKWEKAVEEEHDRMLKHKVWKVVPKQEVPKNAKVLTSTWAMKKKSNGTFRARMNARGFQQVDGQHFDSSSISSPVTNDATIRIVMVMMIVFGWAAELVDVQGAFLSGEFEDNEQIFVEVPQGFEGFYPKEVVLMLIKTLYGLKQAAMAFWRKLIASFKDMKYDRSAADPCLYFAWTMFGLVIWLSWIDDCLVAGDARAVTTSKQQMKDRFDCDDLGKLKEYVGCKAERTDDYVKLTQPVLLQSFEDEFELPKEKPPTTPAEPGKVLMKCKPESELNVNDQFKYRSGVGKLLHMMRWSRPEIMNTVRELSRFMTGGASNAHMKAMKRVMSYCVDTRQRGILLQPDVKWDGNPEFEFVIKGKSDSDYAKDPETRKSVSGNSTFLCGAPIMQRSQMQRIVAISVTESELFAGTTNAQDMLYAKRVIESVGLRVQLPMILEIDNKGAVDLVNNYSVGGRTRHVETRQYFLRQLKEDDIIKVLRAPGTQNCSDLYTKNLALPDFEKHAKAYVGQDQYMKLDNSQGEGVGGG